MIAVRAFVVGLREVFMLERAENRARSRGEAERTRVRRVLAGVRLRRDASRRLPNPVPAIVLLREALTLAGETCGAPEGLELDDLPFAHAESIRADLETRVAHVLDSSDTRSVFAVRVTRWARLTAAALALIAASWAWVHGHYLVHDLAVGKTVTTSPLRGDSPTPDHVVDGHTRGTFGVQTIEAEHPFVTVDLGEEHTIDHVVVFNRGDGWFDESLPLEVDLSSDGEHFASIGVRTEHFVRWSVPAGARRARWVRVTKPQRGYIAINAIEVFGR